MVEVTVGNAQNLPDRAHLSLRMGEVRRQMQYKPDSRFRFEGEEAPRSLMLDVFQKVGSTQVCVDELATSMAGDAAAGGSWPSREGSVEVLLTSGARMSLDVRVVPQACAQQRFAPTPRSGGTGAGLSPGMDTARKGMRESAALKAKTYLDAHGVQRLLQSMVHRLLEAQPDDPMDFMTSYLQDSQRRSIAMLRAKKKTQVLSQMDDEPPGFSVDGSQPLPDLSRHHSTMAAVLAGDASLYDRMAKVTTATGVYFAKCIKSCVDNPGHAMLRSPGVFAADASSCKVFAPAFDPVIAGWHSGYAAGATHPTDMDMAKVLSSPLPDSHVLTVQVVGLRNLQHARFPSACTFDERCSVEATLAQAFASLSGSLEGKYLPLRGSDTFADCLGGMTDREEAVLRADGISVEQPDSAVQRAAGFARHWPHARGVFRTANGEVSLQVNDSDHLRIRSQLSGGDLKKAWQLYKLAENEVEDALKQVDCCYARDPHLGFLTSCPSNLGTGLAIRSVLRLPRLSALPDFQALCKRLGLTARWHMHSGLGRAPDNWEVGCVGRLGVSEAEQMGNLVGGCRALIDVEVRLEAGEAVDVDEVCPVVAPPEAKPRHEPDILVIGEEPEDQGTDTYEYELNEEEEEEADGLGEADCPGFPADDELPPEMPDLSQHHSMMARVLCNDPDIYHKLRGRTTALGTGFGRCIKTGVDNIGHAFMRSVGLVAGDPECYEVFRELFDPVIEARHLRWHESHQHPTNMDATKVTTTVVDPAHTHVLGVKASFSRNLGGFRMPPGIRPDERREVERVLTQALRTAGDMLQGEYLPLRGSDSFPEQPEGMSEAQEASLREVGLLMEDPDSQVLLSAGFGRNWPQARGVYRSDNGKFSAWINEENHLRFDASYQVGTVKSVFQLLAEAHQALERSLATAGHSFAKSERLGYLVTCPLNVGTSLTLAVTMHLPQFSKAADNHITEVCESLGVQARTHWSAGLHRKSQTGVYDISNTDRLGTSEVDQVNLVIEACRVLVELETRLAQGAKIDWRAQPDETIAQLGTLVQSVEKRMTCMSTSVSRTKS